MSNYYYVAIAFVAALAGVLFGYDTGVMSGAILFITNEFQLSPGMNGLVVGAVLFGAFFGAIASGRLTDSFGSRRLLIITACIFILGSLGTALAPSILWLMTGRIVVGVAIGIASYTAPLYISEISPAKHRGSLVSLNQLAISIGILLSYIVDYYCSLYSAWRWMLGLGAVPGALLLLGMIYLPSSPRWVLSKGFEHDARQILQKIRGHTEDIEAELEGIKHTLKQNIREWKAIFSKKIRPVVWLGSGLAIIQQVTGINTILYYAPTILKMSGFGSSSTAILATMGVGVVFVLFTIIALPLIDRIGRRPLLITGLIGMSTGLALLSWMFNNPLFTGAISHWLILMSMILYIACFAFSLGPIMWLMIAEIYPLKVRGAGCSFATCINWASNLLVTATFLQLVHIFEARGTFALYLILSFFSILFVIFLVPETKGVSLEKIEENLFAGKPLRHLGKTND